MSFTHLENRLSNTNIDSYLGIFNDLQEPTRTVLGYTLDIATLLGDAGLLPQFTLFGGYAVLSHLMQEYGPGVAKSWRGSNDIDMAGTSAVINNLHAGYEIKSDLASPNVKDKRTMKLNEKGEETCRIDFYLGDFKKRFGDSIINTHFGIPVPVVEPRDLIRSKLRTPEDELQHTGDILGLLSVLERRKCSPAQIVQNFSPAEKMDLLARTSDGYSRFSRDRLGFFPSGEFYSGMRKYLHARRIVK
jgi:hypothetical protein